MYSLHIVPKANAEVHLGVNAKWPLLMLDCKQTWTVLTNVSIYLEI
jgi:hypothetical protein